MRAYFEESRDISQREELIAIAKEAALDMEPFVAHLDSGAQRAKVLEYCAEAAAQRRFSGVPTAILDDQFILEAALPLEVYRRVVERLSQ